MQYGTESLKIAAVIPTRNRTREIISCLISLSQVHDSFDEIIIVDASDISLMKDRSFRKVFFSGLFSQERLVYVHTRTGLPHQRNKGVSLSYADIVCFFDDEACPSADYTRQVQETFFEHPEYAAGFGYLEGETALWHQTRTDVFSQAGTFTDSGIPLHPGKAVFKFQQTNVLNGCLIARRSVFVRHKFDERMSGYALMEECDFAKRVSSSSCKMFFQPSLRISHASGVPVCKHDSYSSSAMFMWNYSYVFFKNFYPEKKARIFSYFRSVAGFFLYALLRAQLITVVAYTQGLIEFVVLRAPR